MQKHRVYWSLKHGSRIEIQVVYWRADIMNRKSFRIVNRKIHKH